MSGRGEVFDGITGWEGRSASPINLCVGVRARLCVTVSALRCVSEVERKYQCAWESI